MSNTQMSPAQQAQINNRHADGTFAEKTRAEPGLETVAANKVNTSDTNDDRSVAYDAIGDMYKTTKTLDLPDGSKVEMTRMSWVEAETGGIPFGAVEHANAVHDQYGPDECGTTPPPVDGIDYQISSATRSKVFDQDGVLRAETLHYDIAVSRVNDPADGAEQIRESLAELDWDDYFDEDD